MKKEIKIELKTEEPKIIKQFKHGRIGLDIYENNAIMFKLNNENVNWFFAEAKTRDNFISSSDAKIVSIKEKIKNDKLFITIAYKKKDLKLEQYFEIEKDKNYLLTYISLSGKDIVESNYLVPLDFIYPRSNANPLFLSLNQKILCVPYDNDMWVHYDSLTLRPGRTSYDVGAIYDDNSLNGLLIGALDFDIFKNGIRCSAYDARSYKAISGIADENTHDHLEHGFVSGKSVSSSRFMLG